MKRALLAAMAILAVLLLLPPVLGIRAETMIRAQVDALERDSVYRLVVDGYERGWFASIATVDIEVDPVYGALLGGVIESAEPLRVVANVLHGPLWLRDGAGVGLARIEALLNERSADVTLLQNRLAMPYLARLSGRVGPLGAFSFDADIPPIHYADATGELEFSGVLIEGRYANRHLDVEAGFESLILAALAGTATVERFHVTTSLDLLAANLAIGQAEASADRLVVADPYGGPVPLFAADGLSLHSASSLDDEGEFITAEVVYAATGVTAGELGLQIADARLRFNISRLHVESLRRYSETLARLDPLAVQDAEAAARQLGSSVLSHGPQFAIAPLSFRLDDEPFEASLEIRVQPAAAGLDLTNLLALATSLEADAEIDTSKVLAARLATQFAALQLPPGQDPAETAAQIQTLLAMLVEQGILIEDGEHYRAALRFARGALTINGQPLSPFGLF